MFHGCRNCRSSNSLTLGGALMRSPNIRSICLFLNRFMETEADLLGRRAVDIVYNVPVKDVGNVRADVRNRLIANSKIALA